MATPARTWIVRWSHLIAAGRHACSTSPAGGGRHARWLAARGHAVTAIDRDADAMAAARRLRRSDRRRHREAARGRSRAAGFDAVVVTNYLWRPLLPTLLAALAPGGVLLYETFAAGNETRRQAAPARLPARAAVNLLDRRARVCASSPTKTASCADPSASCSAWRRCASRCAGPPRATPLAAGAAPAASAGPDR